MNRSAGQSPVDQKQSRLLQWVTLFLFFYAAVLTLAPAVRLHTWATPYRWEHWLGFGVWLVMTTLAQGQLARRLPDRDPYLFPLAAMLAGWGLLTIWRLDSVMATRQTIWLAISMLLFMGGLRVTGLMNFLRRYKYLWLTSGLLLTALTFLLGTYPGGSGPRLWLGCCGIYLQPSEPLKLLLIIYLAGYLADRLPGSLMLAQFLTPTLILIGAALILLIGQRDLGTASLFILIYTVIIYIATNRRRTLVISVLGLLAAGVLGYLLFDVVRVRVDAWINPWADPVGRSYQIVQSLLAFASGGVFGRGPGLGSPGVVPVAQSDFIFAAIGEEMGLLGSVGLVAVLALLVHRGFQAALRATNTYQRYLAAGITTYLVIQSIFIIGGNLRVLPLTGVTLPFVSYGGSSLVTAFLSLLLLQWISARGEEEPAALPKPLPYLVVSGGLLAGLSVLALAAGVWGVLRRDDLLTRAENPRRVISDRFVPRGAILDRNNQIITTNRGSPGSFERQYDYPALSNTTGYNSPQYGLSGIEAGLDDYLRGLRGNPASLILWDDLVYSQPPPGLNIRLTVDLSLQKQADALLQGHKGALVLLNAQTGEILAISSHPNFDPNQIDRNWQSLLQNPDAPLFNRATQGSYPPGPAVGPFLLAYANARDLSPNPSQALTVTLPIGKRTCALPAQTGLPFGQMVQAGCPGPLAALGQQLGQTALEELYTSLGWYTQPNLPLETANPSASGIQQLAEAAVGQENLTVTPLQMAAASAAISNDGVRPAPQIAGAVLTPQQGWLILPHAAEEDTVFRSGTQATALQLTPRDGKFWQTTALARAHSEELTWFLGGTPPQWQGTPLALALVLEENNPSAAQQIGQKLLQAAQQ